jgi:hypothetical protein
MFAYIRKKHYLCTRKGLNNLSRRLPTKNSKDILIIRVCDLFGCQECRKFLNITRISQQASIAYMGVTYRLYGQFLQPLTR